jgi:hypothetical protein
LLSRHLCLAIGLADPIQIVRAPGSPTPTAGRAFIGGLSTGPTTVSYGNRRDGVFIHLKPNGVFALFGIRPFELASRTVDYQELKGRGVEFLGAPKKEHWGTFATFKDVDGNRFVLSSK